MTASNVIYVPGMAQGIDILSSVLNYDIANMYNTYETRAWSPLVEHSYFQLKDMRTTTCLTVTSSNDSPFTELSCNTLRHQYSNNDITQRTGNFKGFGKASIFSEISNACECDNGIALTEQGLRMWLRNIDGSSIVRGVIDVLEKTMLSAIEDTVFAQSSASGKQLISADDDDIPTIDLTTGGLTRDALVKISTAIFNLGYSTDSTLLVGPRNKFGDLFGSLMTGTGGTQVTPTDLLYGPQLMSRIADAWNYYPTIHPEENFKPRDIVVNGTLKSNVIVAYAIPKGTIALAAGRHIVSPYFGVENNAPVALELPEYVGFNSNALATNMDYYRKFANLRGSGAMLPPLESFVKVVVDSNRGDWVMGINWKAEVFTSAVRARPGAAVRILLAV